MNESTASKPTAAGMVGWDGVHRAGERPAGVHPWALIGAPPEHREWLVGQKTFEPVISELALVDAFCTVDAGHESPTVIGDRTWLQKRVHVGHDSVIGADCEICVGVVLGGHVEIGDGVKVGGNTWVKPRVRIGEGAIIGGGSVVTKDVPAHEVWAGNPSRYMKKAWTHPDQPEPFDYMAFQRAVVGYPTVAELDEWQREAARSGALHGHGVDGDHA